MAPIRNRKPPPCGNESTHFTDGGYCRCLCPKCLDTATGCLCGPCVCVGSKADGDDWHPAEDEAADRPMAQKFGPPKSGNAEPEPTGRQQTEEALLEWLELVPKVLIPRMTDDELSDFARAMAAASIEHLFPVALRSMGLKKEDSDG